MTDFKELGVGALFSGLIWQPHWISKCEGPYSRLSKLALANAEGETFVNRIVFGIPTNAKAIFTEFHPRTLLSAHWMTRGAEPHDFIGEIVGCTLNSVLGPWWRTLASDKRLRFCPICLNKGFHSVLTQICALDICPTHGTPLRDTCVQCGAPAPRFALDRDFSTPLDCVECGSLIAGNGFNPRRPSTWESCNECDEKHQDLWDALSRIGGCRLTWDKLGGWRAETADAYIENKRTLFAILVTALDIPIPPRLFGWQQRSSVQRIGFAPFAATSLGRVAIVKAIRRHLLKQFPRKPKARHQVLQRFCVDLQSGQVLATSDCCPVLHASLIWMFRFGVFPFNSKWDFASYLRINVPLQLLGWPEEIDVVDEAWGRFAWKCLLADRESALAWQSAMADRHASSDRQRWMQLSNTMRQSLSAHVRVPPAVSMLYVRDATEKIVSAWLVGPFETDRLSLCN